MNQNTVHVTSGSCKLMVIMVLGKQWTSDPKGPGSNPTGSSLPQKILMKIWCCLEASKRSADLKFRMLEANGEWFKSKSAQDTEKNKKAVHFKLKVFEI